MPRGWFAGPGLGVLDARYLLLDCTNDPLTAGLEINAATAVEPVCILQTTDDNAANPILQLQNSAGGMLAEMAADGSLGINVTPAEKAHVFHGNMRFDQETAPGAATVAVNPAAGNLNGSYSYRITFVTALGETEAGAQSAVVAPANQQVDLSNIPIGSAEVTARRIYRTLGPGWPGATTAHQLVTTLADNVTTTYTDNIADGALGANAPWSNSTGGFLRVGATRVFEASPALTSIGLNSGAANANVYNSFFGVSAGQGCSSGYNNTLIGHSAGRLLTAQYGTVAIGAFAGEAGGGSGCVFVGPLTGRACTGYAVTLVGFNCGPNTTASYATYYGFNAGLSNLAGVQNTNFGTSAGESCTQGRWNTNAGHFAGQINITSDSNSCFGAAAGRNSTGGSNTYLGFNTGYNQGTGSDNTMVGARAGAGAGAYNATGLVLLGSRAGFNETNSNRLYIANSNTATPLIYGEFDTFRAAFGTAYSVDKYGQLAHASGFFAAVGDAQGSPDSFICRLAQASHAVNTWYALYPDGGALPERLTIAADTGWAIDVLVVGITQNAAQQWMYQIRGGVERDNAGNTTLAATATTVIFESDVNYDAQLAADNVNEALEVQVRRTGGVDYDVRWVATVRLVEVTYPA